MKKEIVLKTKLVYDEENDKFKTFVLESPLSVCYKITQMCNYKCKHCIASSGVDGQYGLETEEVKNILVKIKEAGVQRLDITGGEPYIRKDINEILEYSVHLGLETVITTNGSLLKDEDIQVLSKNKIFTQISIDGPQKINDLLRGKDSYNTAISAIRKLNENNVPVRINFTVQKYNMNYLDDMINICLANDVNNLYVILVSAQGNASSMREDICLDEKEEGIIKGKVSEMRKRKDINVKLLNFKNESTCVLIEANGDFISQSWADEDCIRVGNVWEDDIKKLWVDSKKFDHMMHLLQYIRHPLYTKNDNRG